MPKCRACSSLLGYCHLAGILPAGGTMFGCSQGDGKNKPLLVDELAEALLAIGGDVEKQFDYLETRGVAAPVWPGDVTLQLSYSEDGRYTYPNRRRLVCAVVDAALARYQKEVDDAEV